VSQSKYDLIQVFFLDPRLCRALTTGLQGLTWTREASTLSHMGAKLQPCEVPGYAGNDCRRAVGRKAQAGRCHCGGGVTHSQEGLKADFWVFHVNPSFHWRLPHHARRSHHLVGGRTY